MVTKPTLVIHGHFNYNDMESDKFLEKQENKQIGVTSPDRLWLKRWFVQEVMEKYANECVKAKCIPVVSDSLPLIEFIEEIEYMMKLYGNQRYTQAEAQRDKLAEKLDDIMRLGGNER